MDLGDSSRLSEDERWKIHKRAVLCSDHSECFNLTLLGHVLFILLKLEVDFTSTGLRKQQNTKNEVKNLTHTPVCSADTS